MSSNAPSFDEPRDKGKSRDPLLGTVLDERFQIDDVLGSGGMSVVYLATQLRVNRQVAIKTLKMQLDSKQVYKDRFQREINLLCALSHPHIVTVYDCIFGDDEQSYVVMDYLRGRSLEALIKDEGSVDVDRFARIVVQVCSALEYAHKNGVIHRDLKPGNLVLIDDEMDFVKVVDFGLAKLNQENRKLTQSGELWGSPPYLSPEQCIGKPEDARSDIYSFGCVMYEMLTGKDPFHTGTTIYELIQLHVNTPPPKMQTINPHIKLPDELEAVVFKAMAKDPKDRYQSAQELSNAIVKACAEGSSRESGNLKILAGKGTGSAIEPPSPVSIGLAANNFNLALDPMQGLNVEDAFLERNNRKPAEPQPAAVSADKPGLQTRQLARDRFSNLNAEAEPKQSNSGKFAVAGFVVVVLIAVMLFALVSMRSGKTQTAETSVPANTSTSAPPGDTTKASSAKTQNSNTAKNSINTTVPANTTSTPLLQPAAKTPVQSDSTPQNETARTTAQASITKSTTPVPSRARIPAHSRAATPVKHTAPPKPSSGASSTKQDVWQKLKGLRDD